MEVGSLRDVVDMSGLFIETGPIVQVKARDSRPHPLEDRDAAVLYDGPLVIMVNSFSASASEIMAGCFARLWQSNYCRNIAFYFWKRNCSTFL